MPLNRCPESALHRGKIVPANASAFNKCRPAAAMIIVAAAKWMRREAGLRGGSRAEGSSGQQGNTRRVGLCAVALSGLASMPMSLNQ